MPTWQICDRECLNSNLSKHFPKNAKLSKMSHTDAFEGDIILLCFFKESALWADASYKSKCPSVCVFVCPSVCLSVHFWGTFHGLFAPTSRSRMSNIYRDSESLGKSNGKKWSNIWTFLFGNGLKSPRIFFSLLILRVITALSRWYAGYNCLIPF